MEHVDYIADKLSGRPLAFAGEAPLVCYEAQPLPTLLSQQGVREHARPKLGTLITLFEGALLAATDALSLEPAALGQYLKLY